MHNREIKWEGGDYFVIGTAAGELSDPEPFEEEPYRARPGDLITNDLRAKESFYVSRVSGRDIFGYYVKEY